MDAEIMVVAIVSIVMVAGVLNRWLKTKEITANSGLNAEVESKLDKVDQLEERIAVLEKIVTNKKVKLAEDIENL